jgi:hypothetical protein
MARVPFDHGRHVKAAFPQKSDRAEAGHVDFKLFAVWEGVLPTSERSGVTLALLTPTNLVRFIERWP